MRLPGRLKALSDSRGYRVTSIGKRVIGVHQLVAAAFVGPVPTGFGVCHNDGDPANNRADNLRIDTPKGNMADQYRHGTRVMGERHPAAKFTEADVREIRRLRACGLMHREIGALLGVGRRTIATILQGRTWGWLDAA